MSKEQQSPEEILMEVSEPFLLGIRINLEKNPSANTQLQYKWIKELTSLWKENPDNSPIYKKALYLDSDVTCADFSSIEGLNKFLEKYCKITKQNIADYI